MAERIADAVGLTAAEVLDVAIEALEEMAEEQDEEPTLVMGLEADVDYGQFHGHVTRRGSSNK